jgi:hypothetical protein
MEQPRQLSALLAVTMLVTAAALGADDTFYGSEAREFEVHNPFGVAVTEVHMVQSAHFDGGCKTPKCGVGAPLPGEPLLCAKVGAHFPIDPEDMGEPYNYHIVNRYFDEFLLRAVQFANASRGTATPYR